MFIGYQNDIATFMAETIEELNSIPCVKFDRIEKADFAEKFNGVIYTSEDYLIYAKSEAVREVRNSYLEKYVDPIVSNPLRWGDMTSEEQQLYADYRTYLLDYTELEGWYLQNPKDLDEWKITYEPEVVSDESGDIVSDTVSEIEESEEVSPEHGKVEEPAEATPEETI